MNEEKRIELEDGCYIINKYIDYDLVSSEYFDSDDKPHRNDNKPSGIKYHNGTLNKSNCIYHIHGVNKRTDGEPCVIIYDVNGYTLGFTVSDDTGYVIGHYLVGFIKIDKTMCEPFKEHYYKYSILL